MATASRSVQRSASSPWLRGVALSMCGALIAAPLPALSQVSELDDLVYQGDGYASREMPNRGYVLAHSAAKDSKLWQYWWKSSGSRCARLLIEGGRVTAVKGVDEHDCNQRSSDSSGMSDGAKVAIAAAALIGMAALAHKSHENDKDRNKQSPKDVAEFDRGYRDGLYHQTYHNYNDTSDYRTGYQRGNEKRDAETSYRSDNGHHSGGSSYVNMQDLIGARGNSADDELRARGFASKGGYKQGDKAMSTWWNGSTRQCLSMTVSDGRVKRLDSIVEGNCL